MGQELMIVVSEEHAMQILRHKIESGYNWPKQVGTTVKLETTDSDGPDLWLRDWDHLDIDEIDEGVDLLCTVICEMYETLTGINLNNDEEENG